MALAPHFLSLGRRCLTCLICGVQQALSSILGLSPLPWSVHVHSCCPALAGGRVDEEAAPQPAMRAPGWNCPWPPEHTDRHRDCLGHFSALSQIQINTIPFVPSPCGAAKALGAVGAFHRVKLWQFPWTFHEQLQNSYFRYLWLHTATSQVTLLQTEKLSAKLKCIHKHRI